MPEKPGKQINQGFFRIFFRQLSRYLVVAVILMAACLFLVWQTYQTALDNQVRQAEASLDKGLTMLSDQMARGQMIASSLLNNEYFLKAMLITGDPRPDELMYLKKVQDLIKQLVLSNQIDEEAFLLLRSSNCLVTMNLCTDQTERAYPALFSMGGLSPAAFRDLVFESMEPQRYLGTKKFYSHYHAGKEYAGLTVLINVSSFSARPSSMLGLVVREEVYLDAFLSKIQQTDGYLKVLSPIGQALISHPESLDALEDRPGYVRIERTSASGLTARAGISMRSIAGNILPIIQSAVVLGVVSLLVSIFLALYLAQRSARQLKPLIDTAYSQTQRGLGKGNEYGYIKDAFHHIGELNREQADRIQSLRGSALVCAVENLLILGVYSNKEEEELAFLLERDFSSFQVMQVVYEGMSAYEQEAMLSVIERKLTTLISPERALLLGVRSDESTILVFSGDVDLPDLLSDSLDVFDTEEGMEVHIGVSQVSSGIRQVRKAFLEANHALYMNRIRGISGIWRFEEGAQSSRPFDFTLLLKLNDLILRGDTPAVEALVHETILSPEIQQYPESERIQRFHLLRQMLQNIGESLQSEQSQELLPVWQSGTDIGVQLESLGRYALAQTEQMAERQQKGNMVLKNSLVRFLQENAGNPGLNAAMVAENFNISEKYVYFLLKEQTGKSLSGYVEDVRLDMAEQLLTGTDLSNAAIWQQCGFGSENTFYRAFARRRGLSPAAWRKRSGAW